MGGRAGGGARGGGGAAGGRDRFGNGPLGQKLQKLGAAATKAFYTKGVKDYFDGSTSKGAEKAWANYQTKLDAFKKAYISATGEKPRPDSWQSLAAGHGSGDYGLTI